VTSHRKIVVAGRGFLLIDEMGDFTAAGAAVDVPGRTGGQKSSSTRR
jgi:hypothetical protein